MVKISFIIVNYKTPILLKKCVDNLLKEWPKGEVIVVDNGYEDEKDHESTELIKEHFGKKVTLLSTSNDGISSGYNKGLKYATGDYYCFVGTDAYPTKKALEELVSYIEDRQDVGIVTPKLVLSNGEIDWDAHRGIPTPWASLTHFSKLDKMFPKSKLFNQYFLGYKDFSNPHEIGACISHMMLMRKEVMQKLKKWDEDFWVYGEDIDICYRTKELGYKIMYLPNVEVLHHKGAVVGRKESKDLKGKAKISKDIRSRLSKASVDAMKKFYTKHLAKKYPFFINWIVYLGIWGMGILRTLKNKN